MTPRNKSTLPARQRKAGAHQDGARRPATTCLDDGDDYRCMYCGAFLFDPCKREKSAACSGEERGE
jgi:hypothetical protein